MIAAAPIDEDAAAGAAVAAARTLIGRTGTGRAGSGETRGSDGPALSPAGMK